MEPRVSRLSFWIGGSPIVFQLFLCYTTACFDDKTIGGEYEKEEIIINDYYDVSGFWHDSMW